MFVQVIKGQVADPARAHMAFDRWAEEIAPGATGWLGTTAGVTDDGRFIALARFESEEAGRRNSDRPEQGRWWEEVSRLFSGEATFQNIRNDTLDVIGSPDSAGFVQVIQGRNSDPGRARDLMDSSSAALSDFRPEIIASAVVEHDDDAYTMAAYFTSEAEAREGERKQPPAELAATLEQLNSLAVGESEYFDLRDPWLYSP